MEATIAKFLYVKPDGTSKRRKLIVISKPTDSYFGVEIDDSNDLTAVAGLLDYLVEREEMDKALRLKYGLTDQTVKYRRFKEANITQLTEEKITI